MPDDQPSPLPGHARWGLVLFAIYVSLVSTLALLGQPLPSLPSHLPLPTW